MPSLGWYMQISFFYLSHLNIATAQWASLWHWTSLTEHRVKEYYDYGKISVISLKESHYENTAFVLIAESVQTY